MKLTEAKKDQYFTLLSAPNFQEHRDEAVALKRQYLPPFLFRFRKLNLFALSELRESYIWLADPNEFNDPFDSALSISSLKLLQRQPEWLTSSPFGDTLNEEENKAILKADDPLLTASNIADPTGFTGKFASNLFDQFSRFASEGLSKAIKSTVRICCFCENRDSIVMWSHYAGSHSGVCIQYGTEDLCKNEFFFTHLHPVTYKEELIDVSSFLALPDAPSSHPLMSTIAACNKSPEWCYEREWRFVVPWGLLNKQPRFHLAHHPKSISWEPKFPLREKNSYAR